MYFRELSRSAVLRLHRFLPLSLSLFLCLKSRVARESASSYGKIDWRRWRVNNRIEPRPSRLSDDYRDDYFTYVYHTRIHGVCRRFFARRDTRWEFRPQNPERQLSLSRPGHRFIGGTKRSSSMLCKIFRLARLTCHCLAEWYLASFICSGLDIFMWKAMSSREASRTSNSPIAMRWSPLQILPVSMAWPPAVCRNQ